jgi:peptide deformylase
MFELVDKYDKILKTPTQPWDFNNNYTDLSGKTWEPEEFAKKLALTMINKNGVGLSANQCGHSVSVFVMGDPSNEKTIMAFFNPKLIDFMGDLVYYEEGCLSYPKLFVKIKRPSQVRMRFSDAQGETTTTKYTGFSARIIQHEYDHLSGAIFTDKANDYHLSQAKKNQRLLMRRVNKTAVR